MRFQCRTFYHLFPSFPSPPKSMGTLLQSRSPSKSFPIFQSRGTPPADRLHFQGPPSQFPTDRTPNTQIWDLFSASLPSGWDSLFGKMTLFVFHTSSARWLFYGACRGGSAGFWVFTFLVTWKLKHYPVLVML